MDKITALMTFDDVTAHFRGVAQVKKALGLRSRQTLWNWRHLGIPMKQQYRIQIMTGGVLQADKRRASRMNGKKRVA